MRAAATRPYVEALFSVAGSADAVEKLLPALDAVAAALAGSDELRSTLRNPGIPRRTRRSLLEEVARQAGGDLLVQRFLVVLHDNGRLGDLGALLKAARRRIDEDRHVVEASVRSAVPLPPGAADALRSALARRLKSEVRLVASVDPALLGGFVAQVGSSVYDASLSRRLERAKETLAGAGRIG